MALIQCAGAIVLDERGRLLLVRRGRPPGVGLWSVPGGKCEAGEDAAAACVREAREETGLIVEPIRLAGQVHRPGLDGDIFVIDDYLCRAIGGTLRAGDDAADARWFRPGELSEDQIVPLLLEQLIQWQTLGPDWQAARTAAG